MAREDTGFRRADRRATLARTQSCPAGTFEISDHRRRRSLSGTRTRSQSSMIPAESYLIPGVNGTARSLRPGHSNSTRRRNMRSPDLSVASSPTVCLNPPKDVDPSQLAFFLPGINAKARSCSSDIDVSNRTAPRASLDDIDGSIRSTPRATIEDKPLESPITTRTSMTESTLHTLSSQSQQQRSLAEVGKLSAHLSSSTLSTTKNATFDARSVARSTASATTRKTRESPKRRASSVPPPIKRLLNGSPPIFRRGLSKENAAKANGNNTANPNRDPGSGSDDNMRSRRNPAMWRWLSSTNLANDAKVADSPSAAPSTGTANSSQNGSSKQGSSQTSGSQQTMSHQSASQQTTSQTTSQKGRSTPSLSQHLSSQNPLRQEQLQTGSTRSSITSSLTTSGRHPHSQQSPATNETSRQQDIHFDYLLNEMDADDYTDGGKTVALGDFIAQLTPSPITPDAIIEAFKKAKDVKAKRRGKKQRGSATGTSITLSAAGQNTSLAGSELSTSIAPTLSFTSLQSSIQQSSITQSSVAQSSVAQSSVAPSFSQTSLGKEISNEIGEGPAGSEQPKEKKKKKKKQKKPGKKPALRTEALSVMSATAQSLREPEVKGSKKKKKESSKKEDGKDRALEKSQRSKKSKTKEGRERKKRKDEGGRTKKRRSVSMPAEETRHRVELERSLREPGRKRPSGRAVSHSPDFWEAFEREIGQHQAATTREETNWERESAGNWNDVAFDDSARGNPKTSSLSSRDWDWSAHDRSGLEESGKDLDGSRRGRGDSLEGSLRGRGDSLEGSLRGRGDSLEGSLRGRGDSLEGSLRGRGDSLEGSRRGRGDALDGSRRGLDTSGRGLEGSRRDIDESGRTVAGRKGSNWRDSEQGSEFGGSDRPSSIGASELGDSNHSPGAEEFGRDWAARDVGGHDMSTPVSRRMNRRMSSGNDVVSSSNSSSSRPYVAFDGSSSSIMTEGKLEQLDWSHKSNSTVEVDGTPMRSDRSMRESQRSRRSFMSGETEKFDNRMKARGTKPIFFPPEEEQVLYEEPEEEPRPFGRAPLILSSQVQNNGGLSASVRSSSLSSFDDSGRRSQYEQSLIRPSSAPDGPKRRTTLKASMIEDPSSPSKKRSASMSMATRKALRGQLNESQPSATGQNNPRRSRSAATDLAGQGRRRRSRSRAPHVDRTDSQRGRRSRSTSVLPGSRRSRSKSVAKKPANASRRSRSESLTRRPKESKRRSRSKTTKQTDSPNRRSRSASISRKPAAPKEDDPKRSRSASLTKRKAQLPQPSSSNELSVSKAGRGHSRRMSMAMGAGTGSGATNRLSSPDKLRGPSVDLKSPGSQHLKGNPKADFTSPRESPAFNNEGLLSPRTPSNRPSRSSSMGHGSERGQIRSKAKRVFGQSSTLEGELPRTVSDTTLPRGADSKQSLRRAISYLGNHQFSASYTTARRQPTSTPEIPASKRKMKSFSLHGDYYGTADGTPEPPHYGRSSSDLIRPSSAPEGGRPRKSLREHLLSPRISIPDDTFQSMIRTIQNMATQGEYTSSYYQSRLAHPPSASDKNKARQSLKAALNVTSQKVKKPGKKEEESPRQQWEKDYWKTGEYKYVRRPSSSDEAEVVIPGKGAVAETWDTVSKLTADSYTVSRNSSSRSILSSIEIPLLSVSNSKDKELRKLDTLGLDKTEEEDEEEEDLFDDTQEKLKKRKSKKNKKPPKRSKNAEANVLRESSSAKQEKDEQEGENPSGSPGKKKLPEESPRSVTGVLGDARPPTRRASGRPGGPVIDGR